MTDQETELNAIDHSFYNFTQTMKNKIEAKKEERGDFTEWSSDDFLEGLQREYHELMEAIAEKKGDVVIASECVDVANLAYMLWYSQFNKYLELGRDFKYIKDAHPPQAYRYE